MKAKFRRARLLFFIIWNSLHEITHLIIGYIFYTIAVKTYFPDSISWFLLFFCLFGSLFPDIDHLLYFFIYGKKKEYAMIVKLIFHQNGFREMYKYIKHNHKKQTYLISHNLLTVIFLGLITWSSFVDRNIYIFTFVGAMITHFLADMVDDLIYLGGLNPNWYLRFGREPRARKKKIVNRLLE